MYVCVIVIDEVYHMALDDDDEKPKILRRETKTDIGSLFRRKKGIDVSVSWHDVIASENCISCSIWAKSFTKFLPCTLTRMTPQGKSYKEHTQDACERRKDEKPLTVP